MYTWKKLTAVVKYLNLSKITLISERAIRIAEPKLLRQKKIEVIRHPNKSKSGHVGKATLKDLHSFSN